MRNTRSGSKLQDRGKSDMYKKVEMLENKFEKFEKSQNEMKVKLKENVTK